MAEALTSLILIYEWLWQVIVGGLVVAVRSRAWSNVRETLRKLASGSFEGPRSSGMY